MPDTEKLDSYESGTLELLEHRRAPDEGGQPGLHLEIFREDAAPFGQPGGHPNTASPRKVGGPHAGSAAGSLRPSPGPINGDSAALKGSPAPSNASSPSPAPRSVGHRRLQLMH